MKREIITFILSVLGVIVAGAIVVSLIRWIAIKLRKRLIEKFTEIAARINGSLRASFLGSPSIGGSYKGIPVKIKYLPASEDEPPTLRIDFLKKPLFRLTLKREDWSTRIDKKIGLARKTTLNIPDFDEKFFIQTNDKLNCATYLADSRNREIIEKIYEKGWRLNFGKREIVVTKSLSKSANLLEEKRIKGLKGARELFFKQNIRELFKQEEVNVEEAMNILEALDRLSKGWI